MKDEQLLRYSRHILLDDIGIEAQERLLASTMLIVGAGGLGSPAALYLAAAGVGRLMLADGDTVDLTNLQRQILHTEARVGMAKTASAQLTLAALNPEVEVLALPRLSTEPPDRPHAAPDTTATQTQAGAGDTADTADTAGTAGTADTAACLTANAPTSPRIKEPATLPKTLAAAIAQADVVLDCSDNFPTRQAINRHCVQHGKPLVSGAAIRFDGQVAVFDPREASSPCYHCLFPEGENLEETRCSQMGVFAPLTGIVGTMQAAEALKLAGGFGTPMSGRLILIDARRLRFTDIRVPRDPACPVCSTRV